MSNRLCLTLKSSLAEVETLGQEFGRFAAEHTLPADVRFAVNLALEEVVTNAIVHGYQGRENGLIAVEFRVLPGEIVASVEDSAPAFNPLLMPAPDVSLPLPERREGGLGIFLARRLMDGVEYTRVDERNRLVLWKRYTLEKSPER